MDASDIDQSSHCGKPSDWGRPRFIWRSAGIDISATHGTRATNSNTSDSVNGALFSRNSFVGFSGKDWGSVMLGKSETPYKLSSDRLNPFSGMIGDYRVIMGNTGGDNRVEFGYRAPHAIWYNSPNWSGFSFSAMYGPGQNRSDSSDPIGANSNLASAEQDCAGGNIPGSGALPPSCNDGSFGNLYSDAEFIWESLYLFGAYEEHVKVNRSSDVIGFPTTPPEDTQGDPNDVANETAWKLGGSCVRDQDDGRRHVREVQTQRAVVPLLSERAPARRLLAVPDAGVDGSGRRQRWLGARGLDTGRSGDAQHAGRRESEQSVQHVHDRLEALARSQHDRLRGLGDDGQPHRCAL
jgi:hypothetical protein